MILFRRSVAVRRSVVDVHTATPGERIVRCTLMHSVADNQRSMTRENVINLSPSTTMKVLAGGGAFAIALFLFSIIFYNPDEISPFYKMMGCLMIIFLPIIGIDYLQRVYRFEIDEIKVRYFFYWKTIALPTQILITQNELKQVQIQDAADGRDLLKIPKDYNFDNKLPMTLKTFYAKKL